MGAVIKLCEATDRNCINKEIGVYVTKISWDADFIYHIKREVMFHKLKSALHQNH